jgi:hypothetical protein
MPKVDIGGREISQAFVTALMIAVLDERIDLDFEITWQIVIFQQYPVLQGLVPSLDLALGLRMVGSASDMLHAPIIEPLGQVAGDVARPIVRQQPRLMDGHRLIAA